MPRDTQRGRLYGAEDAALSRWTRRLESVEAMQDYVDRLLASRWFARTFGAGRRLVVYPGFGRRNATASGRVLQMPIWARCEAILLHEVAHCVRPRSAAQGGDPTHAWAAGRGAAHGREFAYTFLLLVRHQMGREAAGALRREFRARGVRYTKPPAFTAEQRARFAELARRNFGIAAKPGPAAG